MGLLCHTKAAVGALLLQMAFLTHWLTQPIRREAAATAHQFATACRDTCHALGGRPVGQLRPDVFEVFGGKAAISHEAARQGLTVSNVVDSRYGWDLHDPLQLRWVEDYVAHSCPRFVAIEFPCGPYTVLTYINYATPQRKQELRRRWRRHRPFIQLTEHIFRTQLARGDHAFAENPLSSRAWRLLPLVRTMMMPGVLQVTCDMCQHGAVHVFSGRPIRKSTKLLVTHPIFAKYLGKLCDRSHVHDHVIGSSRVTEAAGVYTDLFARRVVQALREIFAQSPSYHCQHLPATSDNEALRKTAGLSTDLSSGYAAEGQEGEQGDARHAIPANEALVADQADANGDRDGEDPLDLTADPNQQQEPEQPADKLGAKAISFHPAAAAKCQAAELAMLRRLHVNCGHPSNEDLTRGLRLRGAKEAIWQAAKTMKCQVCASQRLPSPRRPATLTTVQDFADDVGFDCFELADAKGEVFHFFSVVDLATTFHVVKLIKNHSSEGFAQTFEDLWGSWAGPPARAHFDMERGFGGKLQQLFESFGTVQLPIAGQAHWQLGRVERQQGWWKELARRTVQHGQVTGEEEMRIMAMMVSAAKNTMRRRCGFSPAQWVLGKDPKLPADLVDGTEHEKALSLATHDPQLRRRYAIRTAAREAFVRMQGDDQLRRAMLARSRPVSRPISVGELCFIFRLPSRAVGRKIKGVWRGPCICIGHQGDNVWVSLGAQTMLAAPEHVRAVSSEDVWFPGGDDEVDIALRELNRAAQQLAQEDIDHTF